MKPKLKHYIPIATTFLIILLTLLIAGPVIISKNFDILLLHGANAFFFLLFCLSVTIHLKTVNHKNPHVFVRGVMVSILLKMLLTTIGVFAYTTLTEQSYNQYGIFIAVCTYLPYLAAEMIAARRKS